MKIKKVLLKRTPLRPEVPDWIAGWIVPELEDLGPDSFELGHLHDYCPKLAPRKTEDFFCSLQTEGLLGRCLGLQDGMALVSNGIFWTEQFRGKHLCLWRSAAFDSSGCIFMPWVQNITGQHPVIRWWWFEYSLCASHHTVLWIPKLLPSFWPLLATPVAAPAA